MNFTKQILSSTAAVGMAALCIGNASLPFTADAALPLGDVNNDSLVNASDAALVLIAAAGIGAGQGSGLTDEEMTCADVNEDGDVNASDAAQILIYAAHIGAGGSGTLYEFLHPSEEPVVEPTQPGTEPEPVVEPTEPTEPGKPEPDAVWEVGSYPATAGETVTVPVKIASAVKGMNSYIAKLYADPALLVTKIENGSAYPEMGFVYNPDDLTFAGTNYSSPKDLMAAQDSTLCYVTVKVPENAAPGDVYEIGFQSVTCSDYSMVPYSVDAYGGTVTVMG